MSVLVDHIRSFCKWNQNIPTDPTPQIDYCDDKEKQLVDTVTQSKNVSDYSSELTSMTEYRSAIQHIYRINKEYSRLLFNTRMERRETYDEYGKKVISFHKKIYPTLSVDRNVLKID